MLRLHAAHHFSQLHAFQANDHALATPPVEGCVQADYHLHLFSMRRRFCCLWSHPVPYPQDFYVARFPQLLALSPRKCLGRKRNGVDAPFVLLFTRLLPLQEGGGDSATVHSSPDYNFYWQPDINHVVVDKTPAGVLACKGLPGVRSSSRDAPSPRQQRKILA
eukprot:gene18724-biopygen9975